jgi:hypothetical protein
MFLGRYDFTGDPVALRAAYDTFVGQVPASSLPFHCCIETEEGITILDACPSREDFESFSTSDQTLTGMREAGLPAPTVTQLGEVHAARTGERVVFP